MSDKPERVFSEAGAAISTRRRLLLAENVKFTQRLKSWIRSGVFEWTRYGDTLPLPPTPP